MKLTKQQMQYLVLGLLAGGGGLFVYVWYFWLPVSKRIGETEKTLASTQASIDRAQAQANQLPHLQAELVKVKTEQEEVERRLPRKSSMPDILVTIEELADKYDVDVLSFSPGPEKSQQFFTELDYPVKVRGSFHNLGRFFAAVALEERIFNVRDVDYGSPSGGARDLTTSFALISYQYKG